MSDAWVILGCAVAGFLIVSLIMEAMQARRRPSAKPSPTLSTEQASERPWFEVFDLPPSASILEVKAAYKEKARQYHPDKVVGLAPEFADTAEKKMKEINAAYADALRAKVF